MPFRHDADVFRPNGVSRRNFDGLKLPNPSAFGVRGGFGRKAEVQNPNQVSAKCAIGATLRRARLISGDSDRLETTSGDKVGDYQWRYDVLLCREREAVQPVRMPSGTSDEILSFIEGSGVSESRVLSD
jgi:hypothetical protein